MDKSLVGPEQLVHIELTANIARHFNGIYGREEGFEEQVKLAIEPMGREAGRLYWELKI